MSAVMPPDRLPRLPNWAPVIGADAVFSAEECAAVAALVDRTRDGGVVEGPGEGPEKGREEGRGGGQGQEAYRKSRVAWLRPSPETSWVFAKAQGFVEQANAHAYRMELAGYTEPLQVAEYGPGEYYDWHLDLGPDRLSIRKLSFIVQLTDPAAYEGGGVELMAAREPYALPKGLGTMAVFPTYLLHRVTPVTRGLRKSLVGWIGGPHFR
jgi:PKHD-type hydroxylase